uniref:CRC domain-containing protein n=1 Tax=Leersia perrieri TaxID=77586 RepID=A0A0D9W2A6_9ORYZ
MNYQSNEDSVEERMDIVKMNNPRSGPKIVRVVDAMEIDSQSSNAVLEDEQLMNANGCTCWKSKCRHLNCRCFKVCMLCIYTSFDIQPIFTTSCNHAYAKHVVVNMIE